MTSSSHTVSAVLPSIAARAAGHAPAEVLDTGFVRVTDLDRRKLRIGWTPLVETKLREFTIKLRRQPARWRGLIGADSNKVATTFNALSEQEFAEYNFPQVWVERRQFPAAIDGKLPTRNAVVLDLGCGPGTSTELLCHFADPSWSILGFDLTASSIERARARAGRAEFRNRRGHTISPRFVCQDISQPLLEPEGTPVATSSADMAISGGVVGLYMNRESVGRLARELFRVIKPGGYAALDSGPAVPRRMLREIMHEAGFVYAHAARSVAIEPRPKLVFRKPVG